MLSSNLIQWSGLAAVVAAASLVVAELLNLTTAESTCSGKTVAASEDLDAIVNADPAEAATTFCIQAGTYYLSQTLVVGTGDKLIGETGITKTAGSVKYAEPVVKIRNAASLSRLISVSGDSATLKWLDVAGAVGEYDDTKTQATCANWGDIANKCPEAGTGVGVGAGNADGGLLIQYLRVHNNDAVGIGNAKGRVLNSEFFSNTEKGDFLGFTGAAVKGGTEYEAANNYVHDEQGNGLWCDRGCDDDPARGANGFWVHDNLLVDNARAGVRYEHSATSALIENNEIHGNSYAANRGGVSIRDAQNATIRNNVFGSATIAGVTYKANAVAAIRATDSGRTDRRNLRKVEIVDNALDGEKIQGCKLPDNVVYCHDNTSRHANPPSRSFCVGWPLEAICRLVARFYNSILGTTSENTSLPLCVSSRHISLMTPIMGSRMPREHLVIQSLRKNRPLVPYEEVPTSRGWRGEYWQREQEKNLEQPAVGYVALGEPPRRVAGGQALLQRRVLGEAGAEEDDSRATRVDGRVGDVEPAGRVTHLLDGTPTHRLICT